MKLSGSAKNQVQETQLVPIHISWDEVLYFNYLQELITGHQQDTDKKTGLRAYPGLSEAIRMPEIREIFMAITEMIKTGESLGPEIEAITSEEDTKIRERGIPPIPSDEEKDIHKLEKTGQADDKVLVMMPLDVVRFMDILQGEQHDDPILGLQEFGLFDEIIRGVATVGGSILGGPLGAGIGHFVGRVATGQKPEKAIMPAAKIGAYAWTAKQALNAAANYAGTSMTGSQPALSGSGATNAATTTSGTSAAAAGKGAAGIAGKEAAGSTFANLAKEYGPGLALIGGGLYLNKKSDDKKQKEYKEDKEKFERSNQDRINNWNSSGLNQPVMSPRGIPEHIKNPKKRYYRSGGKVLIAPDKPIGKPIIGKGKGQEDLIFVDVPEKTWIHNATFVSDVGDGSTKAGREELEKLRKFAAKHLLTPEIKKKFKEDIKQKPLKSVPCALSDGEDADAPILVTAYGRGNNDTGANILRDMVTEMRSHKISKGHKLPPPAPDIIDLYKKVARKHIGGEI